MVRLVNEHYCYNEQCLYQWCDRCSCSGITVDATGRCTNYMPIRMSSEELKAYKRNYYGVDLAEDVPYKVIHREPSE